MANKYEIKGAIQTTIYTDHEIIGTDYIKINNICYKIEKRILNIINTTEINLEDIESITLYLKKL